MRHLTKTKNQKDLTLRRKDAEETKGFQETPNERILDFSEPDINSPNNFLTRRLRVFASDFYSLT